MGYSKEDNEKANKKIEKYLLQKAEKKANKKPWISFSKKKNEKPPQPGKIKEEKDWFLELYNKTYSDDFSSAYDVIRQMSNEQYIRYHKWEKKHIIFLKNNPPEGTRIFFGEGNANKNLIFHGGCLSCISQEYHGVSRCLSCMYFRANWNNPDLRINND